MASVLKYFYRDDPVLILVHNKTNVSARKNFTVCMQELTDAFRSLQLPDPVAFCPEDEKSYIGAELRELVPDHEGNISPVAAREWIELCVHKLRMDFFPNLGLR